jgi:hypothetical protein
VGGGECDGRPCWKSLKGNGFRYVEKTALVDGAQKLLLKAGDAGGAKVIFKGKGRRLRERTFGDDVLPLTPPVTVQLVASTGACWESVYDAGITRNDATKFVAKPD